LAVLKAFVEQVGLRTEFLRGEAAEFH